MATARKPKGDLVPARKAPRAPMTEAKLIALLEERESRSRKSGTNMDDQAKALSYYLGQPIGNEVEDRSQVIMREVYSTIEWIKPALLRMFFGGDQVVKFAPTGPEDVEQSEQETDVVEHAVVNQNDGFATIYTWFTDALLSKNAYVVAYWDERTDVTESEYENLTIEQATKLTMDGEVEVMEADQGAPDPDTGEPTFNCKLRIKDKIGRVCIETIPPERVLVEANYKHVGLSRCSFVEYWETKTISELREAGFDVDDDIAGDDEGGGEDHDEVSNVRHRRDPLVQRDLQDDPDPASRQVKVRTAFMKVDYDGDGIAEMRRVVAVGKKILRNDPYDRVLIAAITPTIMPHRHVGMSVAEVVMDLQEIKSALLRGMLDNMYLANNGRHAVNEDIVNLDDMMTTRPGGIVRVAGDPHGAIAPLVSPALGAPIIQTIEYMDSVLENRTGASPRVLQGQSFDGNAINKTATGINTIMSAAMARIELIARVFAETGVKELFQIVHTLLLKHGHKRQTMQLRNRWVEIDPREWQKRTNMSVEVGLGNGDKQGRIALLQSIITAQQGVMGMGLSSPKTMYNGLAKLTNEMGFKNPEEFWVNPSSPNAEPPPQPPPDPKVMAEQARISLEQQKAQAQNALEAQKIKADWEKTQLSAQLSQATAFLNAQVDLAKHAMQQDAAQQQAERDQSNREDDRRYDGQKRAEDHKRSQATKGLAADGTPAKPRRRVARMVRGPDGMLVGAEITDIDDDETSE